MGKVRLHAAVFGSSSVTLPPRVVSVRRTVNVPLPKSMSVHPRPSNSHCRRPEKRARRKKASWR